MRARSVLSSCNVIAWVCEDDIDLEGDRQSVRLLVVNDAAAKENIDNSLRSGAADIIVPLADDTELYHFEVTSVSTSDQELYIVLFHGYDCSQTFRRFGLTYSITEHKVISVDTKDLHDCGDFVMVSTNTSGSLLLACSKDNKKGGCYSIKVLGERLNQLRALELNTGTTESASAQSVAGLEFFGSEEQYVLACCGAGTCAVSHAVLLKELHTVVFKRRVKCVTVVGMGRAKRQLSMFL
jgi:hypothetical protein